MVVDLKGDTFTSLIKDSALSDMYADMQSCSDEVKYHIIFRKLMQSIYDRVVPDMDTFLFDSRYLGFRESQIYPKVREVLNIIDMDDIREVFIVAGKGSGKSVIVGISQLRMIYKVLAYVSPAAYFNILEGTYIGAINMSINSTQALNVIFKRFLTYLNLLSEFKKLPKQAIIKFKKDQNEKEFYFKNYTQNESLGKYELFAETSGMITFPGKDIVALSGHSKASAFFGYDVIFGSIDEMSHFEKGNERESEFKQLPSEEIYQGLSSAGVSRFPNHYKIVAISSPRARVGDSLYSRYERVKNLGGKFEVL